MSRKTREEFIQQASKIHDNFYVYLLVIFINCATKVSIICRKHGIFRQTPSNHLSGQGCKPCGVERRANKRRKPTDVFIEQANFKYNNFYNYSLVKYANSNTNITIICPKHGEFNQTPANHLYQGGCPDCGVEKIADHLRKKPEVFKQQASEKHEFFYDYSLSDYVNDATKVIIICPKHGQFKQKPNNHLQGNGCPDCGVEHAAEKIRKSLYTFKQQASTVHNNFYIYTLVDYIDSHTNVTIICPKHGPFKQTPAHHLGGNGCPDCVGQNYSKISVEWLENIAKNDNIFIQHAGNTGEYKIKSPSENSYKVDGYCQSTNTVYEFYGDFWHGNPKIYDLEKVNPKNGKSFGELYRKTIDREEYIKSLGYNLVSIWELDYRQFKKTNVKPTIEPIIKLIIKPEIKPIIKLIIKPEINL